MDGGLGGGGDIRGGDRDRLSRWEDNVANLTLGTELNAPPCLCSGIGTPPPDYGYAWGSRRRVIEREILKNFSHPQVSVYFHEISSHTSIISTKNTNFLL